MTVKWLVPVAVAALALAAPAVAQSADPAAPLAQPGTIARLKPMKWLYVISLVTGESTPQRIGFRTLSLTDTTYAGTPAWLVIDSRQMQTVTYAESLFVARADLRPLYRVEHTPTGQTVSRYAADSIRTVFDDDSGHVAVAMAAERGALPTLYLVEGLIGASSLGPRWAATTRMTAIGRDSSGVVSIALRTVGQERTNVPDGSFDAWVLSLALGKSEETLWVRKSDGVVLREELPVSGMAGARVQMLLGLNGVQTARP
ncbi:MAG TPA: hypothetical protein VL157_13930 [Gemmatimonadaceae bacterium]|jgi:hypothetical protein|nr:hypothetical protein [Gemmatimonadaceae bacterium]